MAKNTITADALWQILLRVSEKMTEKFTEVINTMMQQFTKAISDVVEGKMTAVSTRLDTLESRFSSATSVEMTSTSSPVSSKCQTGSTWCSWSSFTSLCFEFEQENEEIRKRSRNVVIIGLPPMSQTSDIQLVTYLKLNTSTTVWDTWSVHIDYQ